MTYQLLTLEPSQTEESALYLEGITLAANLATKPLAPESWLPSLFSEQAQSVKAEVEGHINQQYSYLKRNEYSLLSLLNEEQRGEQLADFAEGFMMLWPTIEEQWAETSIGDGTLRMLQALLTTMMLAIDEEQTQAQMKEAGIETPPALNDFLGQLDLMINEVAQAADEAMVGAKAQSVNPFKDIGRNDNCPCGSGKKFKQCCGQ
ncbi:YecA family protein [Vibrio coralliilyticus]|uniref:SEC-C metal-binding domain-containing protein n=1 Tax=Vibrio coralliilyticus TaxID=190893 RepID=UPI000BAC20DC|nr:YecA family protein [Vibrio coralliilyticus]NOH52887.1 YecA family protein [Vibrio coralliilyticus]NOI76895.1 YecA family protein [Vibrio coralliilyticus]NRF26526.1 YecA family protein [Vibrio coralliilyticus]NRF28744.1 YecA family protein [Vibrio coralliilyticus]NRF51445.1 YecA family protein [Vibrio coralliilyticus]